MCLHAPSPAHHIRLSTLIAAVGLVVGLLLLASHAPRRLVELELAIPLISLVVSAGNASKLERAAPGIAAWAPVIALVGCDGSGKSTLAGDLEQVIGRDHAVASCYLGLGSGELGLRIKRLPIIGAALERYLSRKAGQTRDKSKTVPGVATAMVVFAFSLLRYRRFRRALALRQQGVIVITDRYPQVEVAGFYDGPGLAAARPGGTLVAWLARHEHDLYAWMASFRPDVVLRLNVDVDTALARKPDHKAGLLAAKIAATPLLRFGGAYMVDIDARQSYADVRSMALATIAPILHRAGQCSAATV